MHSRHAISPAFSAASILKSKISLHELPRKKINQQQPSHRNEQGNMLTPSARPAQHIRERKHEPAKQPEEQPKNHLFQAILSQPHSAHRNSLPQHPRDQPEIDQDKGHHKDKEHNCEPHLKGYSLRARKITQQHKKHQPAEHPQGTEEHVAEQLNPWTERGIFHRPIINKATLTVTNKRAAPPQSALSAALSIPKLSRPPRTF